MSDLKAVINEAGDIVGAVGRFAKSQHDTSDATQKTANLGDCDIPKNFVRDHYTIVKVSGKYKFKKKSAAVIKTVDEARKEAREPKGLAEFKALDPTSTGLTVAKVNEKINAVIKYLQG